MSVIPFSKTCREDLLDPRTPTRLGEWVGVLRIGATAEFGDRRIRNRTGPQLCARPADGLETLGALKAPSLQLLSLLVR
eukprot:52382-Prymnesium_polylepis.1